ncbi:unnamed protein product [Rotaria sordida]|uniref:V-SNARE coiled-coil homology domain-containing protein n=1 Tax=Rotaria sordida TaxID=392033 RepID=A0A818NNG6_9BILA|nr:unnamed protein product [Rotaria sordida]CAF1244015.1 unnamed protein product [Rotaria sordida]CAF3578850.1 unnamed protein product [Rotaria sordida]CAF3610241.1 unnamed protein product [Rotaria sordida]
MSNPGYQSDSVRYTAPSRFQQLQGQVDEVTGVMKKNIELELDRGGKLDDLEYKSDILNEGSRQFAIHSQKLKKKYWWKNCRMWVILGIVIAIIIAIIIVVIVLKTKK